MKLRILLGLAALVVVVACSSDDDCDAAATCAGKTDKIITGDKIIPVCGAETKKDGVTYSWKTEQGTCTCILEQSLAGSFWRRCRFE